jgi:ribosomal-protein-alanine N-acetyltransferase
MDRSVHADEKSDRWPASPRLSFRPWTLEDFPLALSLWGDADVTHFFGGPMTQDGVRTRLALEIEREARLGIQYWPIFLRGSGEFAGCAGLRPWRDDPAVREAGVHIMRSLWGQRLGEEALRAVIEHGVGTLGLRAMTAGHGAEHSNSQALLLRVGFRYTHDELWGPKRLPCCFYELTNPTYNQLQAASP